MESYRQKRQEKKYGPLRAQIDPSWSKEEISPYAITYREESIAIDIAKENERSRLFDTGELNNITKKYHAKINSEEYQKRRSERDAFDTKVKNLVLIFLSEKTFDEDDYPRTLYSTLANVLLNVDFFQYESKMSIDGLKNLILIVLSNEDSGDKLVSAVFKELDEGHEAAHLADLLYANKAIVVAFLTRAKDRLTNAMIDEFRKKAIKIEKFAIALFLGETFPTLDNQYSIAVVGKGRATSVEEVFTELAKYIDGKRTVINCLLDSVEDPLTMIQSGIIPHPDIEMITFKKEDGTHIEFDITMVLSLLAEEVPLDQIGWWLGLDDVTEALRSVRLWSFYTKEGAKNEAKVGNSYASLFAYPDLLYRQSSRPRTDMAMFQMPHSLRSRKSPPVLIETRYYKSRQEARYIPVTRYASGMSKSLYFENRPSDGKEFCGTFFYSEPESTTFLRYQTMHVSFSKFTAYEELKDLYRQVVGGDPLEIEEVAVYEKMLSDVSEYTYMNNIYIAYLCGLLKKDLRYTPSEYAKLIEKGLVQSTCFGYATYIDIPKFQDEEIPVYIGSCNRIGLYASEDLLDQPLCILGKILGIDLIVLKYMIGSRQIVCEVLDTRPRDLSLANLVFVA